MMRKWNPINNEYNNSAINSLNGSACKFFTKSDLNIFSFFTNPRFNRECWCKHNLWFLLECTPLSLSNLLNGQTSLRWDFQLHLKKKHAGDAAILFCFIIAVAWKSYVFLKGRFMCILHGRKLNWRQLCMQTDTQGDRISRGSPTASALAAGARTELIKAIVT